MPEFPSKEAYRKWCADEKTDHVFFTTAEGLNPHNRCDVHDNPAHILHGFVADYDGDGIVFESLLERVNRLPERLRPQWVTETFSKKARVVWEFEEPVVLPPEPKNQQKFLRGLGKELGAHSLAPGLDEVSFSTTTVWELGRRWAKTTSPRLPRETILTTWFNTMKKLVSSGEGGGLATIPLDKVAAALEARYPGFKTRWTAEFTPGARGPLFWIADGIDRIGCMVTETGMRAFSSRSTKGLMTWADLLGVDFVKAHSSEALAEAAGESYYDSGSNEYYVPMGTAWHSHGKDNFLMRLKVAGISHRLKPGQSATDAEQVLVMIQETRRVGGAAPFLFNPDRVVEVNAIPMLNTAPQGKVMKPAEEADPAHWPWLYEFFNNVFDPELQDGNHPRDFFFAWLQRFWMSGLHSEPRLGQIPIIAGKASRGKSFLGVAIMRKIMGGASDACNYLLDGKGFNKELGASPIWNVDDSKSTATFNDHRRFSEMLKKHAASPELLFHPKYADAITIPWYGRIIITCNDDSDSLAIVPTLDGTILDKLHLFKCHPTWAAKFSSLNENNAMLDRELPHFLAWLKAWKPPIGVEDRRNPRYGVVSYHHPALVDSARDSSPDHRFVEILEAWRESMLALVGRDEKPEWHGTCTDLIKSINSDAALAPLMRSYAPVAVGRIMSKVACYYKPIVLVAKSKGLTRYTLDLSATM